MHTRGTQLLVLYGMAALAVACRDATTAPSWPVLVQLRLVNGTTEAVFIRAKGDESLSPGIANLAPNDSACTTVNAYADSVPVEVRSWIDPGIIYGSGWIYPLRSPGWHAVVDHSALVITRSMACS